jgi:bis(5'-nucleosyl)-tetraphosphatase (symmetrical)
LVNRGPQSLQTLRFVKALGTNAITVLGNHDLHLLALAYGARTRRPDDASLAAVLTARDRHHLYEWLLQRPLAHYNAAKGDLLVHAGLVPQWTAAQAAQLAYDTSKALQAKPEAVLRQMYGDQPDRWRDTLTPKQRNRFVINVLTRLRYCNADGRLALRRKDAPLPSQLRATGRLPRAQPRAWFAVPGRRSQRSRIICGHWSTLGLVQRSGLLALDTGCVWGGALTAVDLDRDTIWQQPRR